MTPKRPAQATAPGVAEPPGDALELGAASLLALGAMLAELAERPGDYREAQEELQAAAVLLRSTIERLGGESGTESLSGQLAHGFVTRRRRG